MKPKHHMRTCILIVFNTRARVCVCVCVCVCKINITADGHKVSMRIFFIEQTKRVFSIWRAHTHTCMHIVRFLVFYYKLSKSFDKFA